MPTSSRPSMVFVLTAILAVAALLACSGGKGETTTDPCVPIVNGLYIYQPGLLVRARDAAGRGAMLGDSITVYAGADSQRTVGRDTLQQYAGYATPGMFSLRVRRRYYQEATVSHIAVLGGACGSVVTDTVPVTLTLAPGAPALRAVDVIGTTFLNAPGVAIQLTARFDADPTVPRTVFWRLSDTTQARVDANGVLTAKCTTAARPDTVSVLATADTMVRGRAVFGVAQQASCP